MFNKRVIAIFTAVSMVCGMNVAAFANEAGGESLLEESVDSDSEKTVTTQSEDNKSEDVDNSETVTTQASFEDCDVFIRWCVLNPGCDKGDYDDENLGSLVYRNSDGSYSTLVVDMTKFTIDGRTFMKEDEIDEGYDVSGNTVTITAPAVTIDGDYTGKWVCDSQLKDMDEYSEYFVDDYVESIFGKTELDPGETATVDVTDKDVENLEDYDGIGYAFVLTSGTSASSSTMSTNDKIVEKTVTTGNYKIVTDINEKPAFTGGKLRATDLISSFKINGTSYDAKNIKIKAEGGKTVGSTVKVTIKKIKGASKEVNKAIKGTVLDTVTIRAIDVSEVVTSSSSYSKEGQIIVKKNKSGGIKSVKVLTSKKGVNSGDSRVKKRSVKKNGYTYDSSSKKLTFNGKQLTGSVTIS